MFLIQKYTQYKAAQAEQQKRKVTEKELAQLNSKIDKLLSKLDEHEPELANNQDEECVVCVHAKATMQTYPCGHRVVCRKCFVKTIQMAVAQRLLPLRCVMCRAKILRLKHTGASGVSSSASQYTISGGQWYHVPQSASLYSVTSSTSGVSGVSSASSCSSASSYKTCASSFSAVSLKSKRSYSSYSKMGYQPLRTSSPSPSRSPQPRSGIMVKKDNKVAPVLDSPIGNGQVPKGKLTLIREFQREYRHGKEQSANERKCSSAGSTYKPGSTRIKCARLLVNQAQSSCSDIPTPTGNPPSAIPAGKGTEATTTTTSTTAPPNRKGSPCGAAGKPGTPSISRSSSNSSSVAASGRNKTGSVSSSGGKALASSSSSTSSSNAKHHHSQQPPPPSSQSCPSLRLSRRESAGSSGSGVVTNNACNSHERKSCENSREILSASGLTASVSKDRVRFASPSIFPSSKSRTPAGAGGGLASIPLLSK
ncbi:unnamed protein product [Orchesella dallaii]|uniref:RING-type domain-containing protein n=1 Tax=Orchesella dallaii TaxID=48710 RepID=A0ABP1RX14_9HEXA